MNKIIVKTNKNFTDITNNIRETKEIKNFLICINDHIIDTNKKTVIKKAFQNMLLNNEITLEKLLETNIQISLYSLWFFHTEPIKIKDLFTITIK